jgi:metallo-beta-lactamase family protein
MRIRCLGASGEVTGSSYLVETADARVLIDFGMFQGGREDYLRNIVPPELEPERLDAVLITHAHNDHVGRLPLLPGARFRSPIYATEATVSLASIMLRDAGHIQEADTVRINFRRQQRGKPPIQPLYTLADVERVLPAFRPVPLRAPIPVAPGISARWHEAGHILGSASIELEVRDGGKKSTVLFSGDIGPTASPILRDPAPPSPADVIFLESTYGDRDHRPLAQTVDEFCEIIKAAVWAKEKIIIPAFAIGRTQSLIYHLARLLETGRVPRFPTYIDSPMAIETVELYRRHTELFDQESREIRRNGHDPLDLPGLAFCRTSEESRRLNTLEGAGVIIAGSGMCTGGRILHHLKHHLWRRDAQIMIVGYQSEGSLGRQLVERAAEVKIMGDVIPVRAKIHTLGGFSAHAGQSELVAWAKRAAGGGKPRVVLSHGEPGPRAALALRPAAELGVTPELPAFNEVITL